MNSDYIFLLFIQVFPVYSKLECNLEDLNLKLMDVNF